MDNLEKYITLERLKNAKPNLVPYIFSENYFRILKNKISNKKLSENERYYYNHFIKKKLKGIADLFEVSEKINGEEFIINERLDKAIKLLKKYSRKRRNKKILISGSFLYNKKYNDIDVFIISKYDKEDYRDGKVHVNYLSHDVEGTLFFRSITGISIQNFHFEKKQLKDRITINNILSLYELTILLVMQNDNYLQELRELVLNVEHLVSGIVLNSMQLKIVVDKIMKSKSPIKVINNIVINLLSITFNKKVKKILDRFIEKNSQPEKGKTYKNWEIYNDTYKEALKVVA